MTPVAAADASSQAASAAASSSLSDQILERVYQILQIADHPELTEYLSQLRHGTHDDMQALMENLDTLALEGMLEGWDEACDDLDIDRDDAMYGRAAAAGVATRSAAESLMLSRRSR